MSKTDEAIAAVIEEGSSWWEEKFAPKVILDPVFGCHLWRGVVDRNGYGKVSVSLTAKPTTVLAHRLTYAKAKGLAALPVGKAGHRRNDLVLDHTCFNHSCVNPDHLRAIPTYLNIYLGKNRRFERWESPQ